jgi:pimeloyl-ACP methyl ester carboxylesterase
MERLAPTDPEPRLIETRVGPIGITEEGAPGATPVLCIHGLPGSTRDFRHLAPHLAGCLRVIRLDMPGFASSPAGTIRTIEGWARTAAAVADALELHRFGILAHSFGGGAAVLAAAEAGERAAFLALIASVGARRHRAYAWPRPLVRLLLVGTWFPLLSGHIQGFAKAHYRRLGLPLPRNLAELRHHLGLMASLDFARVGRAARRVDCPALVAWALDDPLVEPEVGRELVHLIPGAEGLELPDGGHHLQKTRAPLVAEAICNRLERADRRSAPGRLELQRNVEGGRAVGQGAH